MEIGDMVRTDTGNVGRVVDTTHKCGCDHLHKGDGVQVQMSDGSCYWLWVSEVTPV